MKLIVVDGVQSCGVPLMKKCFQNTKIKMTSVTPQITGAYRKTAGRQKLLYGFCQLIYVLLQLCDIKFSPCLSQKSMNVSKHTHYFVCFVCSHFWDD